MLTITVAAAAINEEVSTFADAHSDSVHSLA